MNHERNTSKSKVTLLALNASIAHEGLAAYHTVYVHRTPSICNVYLDVSKASAGRVMRAQCTIIAGAEATHG